MRRKLSALLCLILLFVTLACAGAHAAPEDYDAENPQTLTADMLYSEAAVLMDAASGNVLFGKNEYTRMHPASTTKIMTLLLGIESGFDLDQQISIPQAAADIAKDSTCIPVYPGDTMSYRDLLVGFFLNSGNDGANAVAVLVSGTIEAFVQRMNERAAQIGCRDTHFANAHGYTAAEHYTTAYDMALITREAMQNATFREIAGMGKATIHINERGDVNVGRSRLILQPGSPIYYEGITGVKSGTTSAAGNCFVGSAERDGAQLISVAFKAPEDEQRYTDTARLLNYGWTRYDAYTLDEMYRIARGQIVNIVISNAAPDDPYDGRLVLEIAQVSNSSYLRMVERDNERALNEAVADFVSRSQVQLPHDLSAPISQGEIIGDFSYFDPVTGNAVTAKLIASRDVAARRTLAMLSDYFPFLRAFGNPLFVVLLVVLAALVVLIIALIVRLRAEEQRRRRRIYERRKREYQRRMSEGRSQPSAAPDPRSPARDATRRYVPSDRRSAPSGERKPRR